MDFKNKVVLITGASRGIGRATAEKFLVNGCKVYGTYNTSFKKMLELQKKYGKENFVICGPYDFTDIKQTEKLIKDLVRIEFDTVVCSAGIFSENDDFLKFDLKEFNKVMNCNLYSAMLLGIKLQNNIKRGGNIVIMSSNDAYSGAFASISYSLSKAALLSLTKSLCVNYGSKNIRVNSIAPGSISTDMSTPEQEHDAPEFTPINRVGQASEIAEVIYFLSSPNSSFINGENITIDGGYGNVSVLLKNESSRIRRKGNYEDVFKTYKQMKKGSRLVHLSPCADYTFIDNPYEKELLAQTIKATKRGASIYEILIVDEKREKELQHSIIVKKYYDGVKPNGRLYLVRKADVLKYCPEDYRIMGEGYGIFNSNSAFVDFYPLADGTIGYTVEDKKLVDPLVNSSNNILKNIKAKKIKELKLM